MNATKTVVGVFDRIEYAQNALNELKQNGFPRDDISFIATRNVTGQSKAGSGGDRMGVTTGVKGGNVAAEAGIGAALGGIGGLLWSFAVLAVPGVGPVFALGPLIAALSGAGVGAVAGGIVGALTEPGIPQSEAQCYAEGVRRGQILVAMRTDDKQADKARDIFDRNGAVDVESRAADWRQRGGTGHDPGAEPLSEDELLREREYYAESARQANEWKLTQREMQSADPALRGTVGRIMRRIR
jgi:hypothetical protein